MVEKVVLAAPRGFCAGVAYAIEVVDLALKVYGSPLHVRHAIVHNEWVVRSFEARGVVFVEDLHDVPEGSVIVFSAHGVSPAVRELAEQRSLKIVDATCPLVTRVHNVAKRLAQKGYHMVYIGHRGHVEAEGTMGEAPDQMTLVETVEDVEGLDLSNHPKLAIVTQTTLSVDEVERVAEALVVKYPHIERPDNSDICYATTNRQAAVRQLADVCDLVLVVGSRSSSNSNRLREVAEACGSTALLVGSAEDVQPEWRHQHKVVGITGGASTPESVLEGVLGKLLEGNPVPVEVLEVVRESVQFTPPRKLIQLAMAQR